MAFSVSPDSYFPFQLEDLPPDFIPSLEETTLTESTTTLDPWAVDDTPPRSLLSRIIPKLSPQAMFDYFTKDPEERTNCYIPFIRRRLAPTLNMPSLFNETSERGIEAPAQHTRQRGAYDEVLRNLDDVGKRYREIWLLESTFYYRELDVARNYTLVVPRGLNARPFVSGKTNCIEGIEAMYKEANKYFIESWTGRQRRLIVKMRRVPPKCCHPKPPTPSVERSAAVRIAALDNHQKIVYNLGASTVGVRAQWQMFKEDIKPKVGTFELMPYRIKYFGDLDMDLKDGLVIDFSFCECNWKMSQQGMGLELMGCGPVLEKTCKAVGSSMRPECPNCQSLFKMQEMVRRL